MKAVAYTRMGREEDIIGKTVGYLRLSKEDGDDVESSSISNQRKIISDYAAQRNITIDDWYIDDGISGYTMSRPSFNKLKRDLNDNKVYTIIVKDLSRLGRHGAKVQLFLENILEEDKRVLSIREGYDTLIPNTHNYVGIHTWANENFIRETSTKIRDSVVALQREGKWLCSIPYGYKKDTKDKYTYYVDKNIAPYVKQIFDMYIEGMGIKLIARLLTENNVPTPTIVKKMYMEEKGSVCKRKITTTWGAIAVKRILCNEFYTGTLILGKSKRRSINGKSIIQPEEKRYIFKDAHEPIIDKHTFNLVQAIMADRAEKDYRGKKNQTRPNIFAGTLYCADCGKTLTSNSGRANNTRYICRTYNVYGTSHCTSHAVSEREIKYALLDFLEHCKENLYEIINDLNNIIQAEAQVKNDSSNNIALLTTKIQEVKRSIEILIEQKMRETQKNQAMVDVIDKMYDGMLNEKYKEMQILEKQFNDQHKIALDEVKMKQNLNSALSIINDIINSETITKKQVLMLVDKIVVHEDTGIDIYLKGDLHKICDNYFRVTDSHKHRLKRLIYDCIIERPDKFTTNECEVYIREHGYKISYKKVSKVLKEELLANQLIEIRPMNHGYKLVVTPEELKAKFIPHTLANISRWLCNNNEIFAVLIKINEWIEKIKYEGQKNLF